MDFAIDTGNPHFAKAADLARAFAEDAVARDKAGGRPLAPIARLKASGLLSLLIPAEYGGDGQPWSAALRIVREFSKTDAALGHLFGYHFHALGVPLRRAEPEQRKRLLTESVRNNWYWGHSGNPMSHGLLGRRDGNHWVLNGHHPFSSGSHVADMIIVAWEEDGHPNEPRTFAAVPADRAGIRILDDWDGIGQRQTGSGTVAYDNVQVYGDEVMGVAYGGNAPHTTVGAAIAQSVLINVFVGTAQGALEEARAYTNQKSRPWLTSGVQRAVDDPWVKRVYGELYSQTLAATTLADHALATLDATLAKGAALTAAERGANAVTVAAANSVAGDVALRVCTKIFEVTGARSATTAVGLDRHWRNVRTHTLHNPVEYKMRNVGAWFLTGRYPDPGAYQ